jgi:hypothetical protein
MGNIHFMLLSPPDKHRELVGKINKWKYDIDGKHFKGKQSPYIAELRFYEVRLPEQLEPQFIRDLGLVDLLKNQGGQTRNWQYKLLDRILRILRHFTPYKPLPEPAKGEKQYQLPQWYYAIAFGKMRRAPVEIKTGGKREAL